MTKGKKGDDPKPPRRSGSHRRRGPVTGRFVERGHSASRAVNPRTSSARVVSSPASSGRLRVRRAREVPESANDFYARWDRATPDERRAIIAGIRERAHQQAVFLRNVPREKVAAQLRETLERIRQEAIENGTAIDDDLEWLESQADAPRGARY